MKRRRWSSAAEFFNLFNKTNFGAPNASTSDLPEGNTSAASARCAARAGAADSVCAEAQLLRISAQRHRAHRDRERGEREESTLSSFFLSLCVSVSLWLISFVGEDEKRLVAEFRVMAIGRIEARGEAVILDDPPHRPGCNQRRKRGRRIRRLTSTHSAGIIVSLYSLRQL